MKQIPLFKVRMAEEAPGAVAKVLRSGYIGEGGQVRKFEKRLQKLFCNDKTLTVNSATSAEHLALHLLKKPMGYDPEYSQFNIGFDRKWPGLKDGDEVLTTALTCTATNWPILANGLKIKWVDVDPTTMNMDLDDLTSKITPTTKIIMVVHWGGYPINIKKLDQVCTNCEEKYGFRPMVIQDCAHALGSKYQNRPLSDWGHVCTYSFQAIKHMTCGDGGALVLPYKDLYDRGKLLRWYGIDREQPRTDFRCESNIKEFGFKFHMNDINASIGLANLSLLDDTLRCHRTNARFYYNTLLMDGIKLPPPLAANNESAWWLFTLRVKDRDNFIRMMADKGVTTSRVHERNDKHSCVSEFTTDLPGVDKAVSEMVCIPCGFWVGQSEREYILQCIKQGW